ncbi:hypothetical protein ACJDT4_00900 [Clostridium neuense]|uniref:Lipoprotein n=1 Tax=Clostridium neuense TaxID=1728934 RepID=A0ABW8T8Z2_9CLOT
MKKINSIIFIFVIIIAFILYKNMNLYFNVRIAPTRNTKVPLYGVWTVSKFQIAGQTDLTDEKIKAFIGEKATFTNVEAKFNNDICKRPNYKIKIVDAEKYFLSNFKIKASEVGINEKDVKVITISSRNSFYDEYIQINDNYILKNYQGVFFFLKKNGVVQNKQKEFEYSKNKEDYKRKTEMQNGVLMGLRCQTDNGYEYKTLWIYGKGQNQFQSKEINNLIVPRKNGFMVIGVDKINENGVYARDQIWTGTLNTATNNIVRTIHKPQQNDIDYKINFVGNEYISLESNDLKSNSDGKYVAKSYLSVLPLDNIYGNSIAFSKIIGPNSDGLLSKNAEEYLGKIGKPNYKLDKDELETNWGIIRYKGKWILRGRVANENFSVNVETPKILTTYDNLLIPFKNIQDKFPGALDAYTSLNNNFMLVVESNDIKIVSIDNDTIGKVQKIIPIDEKAQVVMSQWATGTYVDKWNKNFQDIK